MFEPAGPVGALDFSFGSGVGCIDGRKGGICKGTLRTVCAGWFFLIRDDAAGKEGPGGEVFEVREGGGGRILRRAL